MQFSLLEILILSVLLRYQNVDVMIIPHRSFVMCIMLVHVIGFLIDRNDWYHTPPLTTTTTERVGIHFPLVWA